MAPPKQPKKTPKALIDWKDPKVISDWRDREDRLAIRWPELFKHNLWCKEVRATFSEVAWAERQQHALSLARKPPSKMSEEERHEFAVHLFKSIAIPENSDDLYILEGKESEDVENAAGIDPEYAAYLESSICAFLSDGDGDVSDVAKAWYKKRKALK